MGRPLRPAQQALVETMLPRLEVFLPTPDGQAFAATDREKWLDSLFPAHPTAKAAPEIWLEVGFGGGEHLAWQAKHHPEIGFIGCEPFINGVGRLLTQLDQQGSQNVRIFRDDARFLVKALPDQSISRMFLLFPDPWPKKRHWRRRFIQPDTLQDLARILKPGSELRLASDDMSVLRWMLWQTTQCSAFQWLAKRPCDWEQRPEDWPQTRYEAKGIRAGRKPAFLRFIRRDF